MLRYAVVFFCIALVAAIFGFGGIASGAVEIAKILFFLFSETFAQPEHPRLKYQKSHLKIDFLLKFLKTQAKSLVLQFKTPVLKAFHPPQADLCHRFTQ